MANETQTKDQYQEHILGDHALDIASRVDANQDQNRLKAATALINTFNYAVQVQAGRNNWTPADYHKFIRALIALDSIGSEVVMSTRGARIEADIRAAASVGQAGQLEQGQQVQQPFNPAEANEEPEPIDNTIPAEVQKFAPAPSRQAPLSSIPRRANQVRSEDGTVRDDLRLPR